MTDELCCPYCEADLGDYIDDCHEPDDQYEYQCSKCNKNFVFTICYCPSFDSEKADCLNGAEHDYKKMIGVPEEHFKNKRRCKMCSKIIIVDEDVFIKPGDEE